MKKIFAIALAVVMVLSMASAFAVSVDCETLVFDWTCKTDATLCGKGTVEVVPYVKVHTSCGWEWQVSDCAAAIKTENVYYAIKMTVDANSDPDWWDVAKLTIEVEGLENPVELNKATAWGTGVVADDETQVYYLADNAQKWINVEDWEDLTAAQQDAYIFGAKVLDQNVCTSDGYSVCATLTSYNNGIGEYVYGDYTIQTAYDKDTEEGSISVGKDGKWVAYMIEGGEIVEIKGTKDTDYIAEVNALLNLGCAYGVCVNEDNLEAIFGWDFEQEDCFDWSEKGAAVVDTDCVVAIPKTGDASVLAWLF